MKEEWRDVVGWEGLYQVSDWGRVRRVARDAILKNGRPRSYSESLLSATKPDPYPRVTLKEGGRDTGRARTVRIHILVAEAFIGPAPKGYEVNHKDGNKGNNYLYNLEYTTRQDNVTHYNEVLGRGNQGSKHGLSKTNETTVLEIRRLYKSGVPPKEIARAFDMSDGWIGKIVRGDSWKHVK